MASEIERCDPCGVLDAAASRIREIDESANIVPASSAGPVDGTIHCDRELAVAAVEFGWRYIQYLAPRNAPVRLESIGRGHPSEFVIRITKLQTNSFRPPCRRTDRPVPLMRHVAAVAAEHAGGRLSDLDAQPGLELHWTVVA